MKEWKMIRHSPRAMSFLHIADFTPELIRRDTDGYYTLLQEEITVVKSMH